MALPPPAPREHLHTRQIRLDGFCREDGLWDIEGKITDIKEYAYSSATRGEVSAGQRVHHMHVRLTVDDRYVVQDVDVAMAVTPYDLCPSVEPNFKALKGLQIGPGWMKRVRERVGGKHGCTHVVELFGPLATVAFQTIPAGKRHRDGEREEKQQANPGRKPHMIGGCVSWAYDSPIVKHRFPQWYREDTLDQNEQQKVSD